jgi:Mce-associated membrane protein
MTNEETASGETAGAEIDAAKPATVDEATKAKATETDSAAISEDESSAGEVESKDSDNAAKEKEFGKRQLSFSVRSLMVAAVIVVLVAAVGVLGWLYVGARSKLDEQARQSENDVRAEKVALDYAVNAAAMSYEDLKVWKEKLVAGTSPELKDKLTKAATSMEQILVPLQWTSTASPLAAKVVSKNGGAYVVDSFVTVLTKTMQAPDPLRSTATYSVTIDTNKNWQISDVGGIGAVVEQK